MTIEDAVRLRQSVRSFTDETPLVETLQAFCAPYPQLVAIEPLGSGRIGTYGIISGKPGYVAVLAGNDLQGGIQGEQLILELTRAGYATCWLGGTFNRKLAESCAAGREIRAVIAVGKAASRRTLVDKIMCRSISARKRKPLEELILSGIPSASQLTALEAVRLAPSACNRQPWRFSFKDNGEIHLFATPSDSYMLLDSGIAIAHFLALRSDYELAKIASFHPNLAAIAILRPKNG